MIGLCVFAVAQIAAAQQQGSHEGTVVKAGNGKLDMKTDDGKEHSHTIGATVQITVHGKPGNSRTCKKARESW